jgi:hypothetical protein
VEFCSFGVPRAETIIENGMTVPPALGVATAINFQPTGGGGKAAITGDFVLLGKEANPVMEALRDNGIQVTALHSHMVTAEPWLFFMHFWANDDAAKLAGGTKGGARPDELEKVNEVRAHFHSKNRQPTITIADRKLTIGIPRRLA